MAAEIKERKKRKKRRVNRANPLQAQKTSSTIKIEAPETEKPTPSTCDVRHDGFEWQHKKPAPTDKPVLTPCIVIDKYGKWYNGVRVDLKGQDASDFTWGYYGSYCPVLIEKEGKLAPYYHSDIAGESSHRLYNASHPEAYHGAFKHRHNLMQKIQIGLMVGVVLGLFFLIYVFASSNGGM